MADQFYDAPVQGYSWAGQPPSSSNPFATAGTSMIQDYAIMRQQQDMQMYQRAMTPPQFRSNYQQSQMAFNPENTFGMMDGVYQAQQQSTRNSRAGSAAFALTAGGFMATLPLYDAGSKIAHAGFGLMGVTDASMAARGAFARGAFTVGRGAVGMGIGSVLAAPVTMIAERGIERQQWANDITNDIESYSGRWTQGVGFGAAPTRALGRDMMRGMQDRPEFFRPEDQMKIHKMGLASGMLRGNDIGEYRKNFDDLKKNAQDIVKMLNTTIEGGMSVMKEMQGAGMRSPAMMAQQIAQAKAYGNISGIGTQNMLGIGMAGAQNTVGTGWSAVSGSNMYQTTAMNLTMSAQKSANASQEVIGLGGIANATAQVANAQMNMMRSGFGLRAMTSIMDPRTKLLNYDALDRLGGGDMGAGEMMGKSSTYGTSGPGGGAENRVTAWRDVMRNYNNMSAQAQMKVQRGTYAAWAANRGGVNENTAFAFAQQFAPNEMSADLYAQQLIGSSGEARERMARETTSANLRYSNYNYQNSMERALYGIGRGANNLLSAAGDTAYSAASTAITGVVGFERYLYNAAFNNTIGRLTGTEFRESYKGPASEKVAQTMYGWNSATLSEAKAYYATRNNSSNETTWNQKQAGEMLAMKAMSNPATANKITTELDKFVVDYMAQGNEGKFWERGTVSREALGDFASTHLTGSDISGVYSEVGKRLGGLNFSYLEGAKIMASADVNKRESMNTAFKNAERAWYSSYTGTRTGENGALGRSEMIALAGKEWGVSNPTLYNAYINQSGYQPVTMSDREIRSSVSTKQYEDSKRRLDLITSAFNPINSIKRAMDWEKDRSHSGYEEGVWNSSMTSDQANAINEATASWAGKKFGSITDLQNSVKAYEDSQANWKMSGITQEVSRGVTDSAKLKNLDTALQSVLSKDVTYKDNKPVAPFTITDVKQILETPFAKNMNLGLQFKSADAAIKAPEAFQKAILEGIQYGEDATSIIKAEYESAQRDLASLISSLKKEGKTNKQIYGDGTSDGDKRVKELMDRQDKLRGTVSEVHSGSNSNGLVAASTPPNILNYWSSNWRAG